MGQWAAGALAVAAVVATYLSCVRPHRHGSMCCMRRAASSADDLDREVAELREEVRRLGE